MSAITETISTVGSLVSPADGGLDQEPTVVECCWSPMPCTLAVMRVARETFAAVGKGALGMGIVISLADKEQTFAYRVSAICLAGVGVTCMTISSVIGALSNVKCVKPKK